MKSKHSVMKFEKTENVSIWFTSDFHFNHKNIAGKSVSNWSNKYRTFDSPHEMNTELLSQINKNVSENDILFFLGDFCFKTPQAIPQLRDKINCKTIHFIRGNHDIKIDNYKDVFSSFNDYLEVEYDKSKFILFHYPILSWHHIARGTIMVHGHCHSNVNINDENTKCKRIDCGIDHAYRLFGEYRPFKAEEIIELTANNPIFSIDKR